MHVHRYEAAGRQVDLLYSPIELLQPLQRLFTYDMLTDFNDMTSAAKSLTELLVATLLLVAWKGEEELCEALRGADFVAVVCKGCFFFHVGWQVLCYVISLYHVVSPEWSWKPQFWRH